MAIEKIEYQNKEAIDDVGVPEKNKVTAENMNEIKSVVNNNADEMEDADNALSSRIDEVSSAVNNIVENTYTKSETNNLLSSKADKSEIPDVSRFITKDVNDLTNYTVKTSTGSLIDLEINQSNYVVSLKLKDIDGNVISSDNIDLPLESVVVGGSYDAVNKKIVLTLENGNTVDIPVGDLIAGLQTEITSQNKLASDLVDDSNSGNKFVTTTEKNTWNAKYDKPSGGIPKTDLASDVQTSLGKADTAIQDISGKQDITDNNLTTINKTITSAINEVDSIAKGANQALSYGNYSTMITAFNSLANNVYNVGQNVMIVTLQVPDLWISGIESTSQTYTYTTDEAITTALETTGYIQVGYYKLSALETQKVDLTDYEQNTNKTTTISSSSTNAQYPSAKAVYDYIQSLDGDEVSY